MDDLVTCRLRARNLSLFEKFIDYKSYFTTKDYPARDSSGQDAPAGRHF